MRTKQIRLTSAVTVLSSDDPVRVFQDFATLDPLSEGRAEIMAGRGSFIESFPLFGYDLGDYDDLFAEKLELLLKLRENERVTWRGKHRPAIENLGVYPRPFQRESRDSDARRAVEMGDGVEADAGLTLRILAPRPNGWGYGFHGFYRLN